MIPSHRTVLFVDDESHVTAGLTRLLHGEPYEVFTAASAEEALAILETHEIDALLTDEGLPGMSGSALLTEVKLRWPDVARMMLTGQMDLSLAKQAINEGQVWRFFTKPCDALDLVFGIRSAVQMSALKRESSRMLELFRHQRQQLEKLELEDPEILRVRRDDSGAVLVETEALPTDIDQFLEEIRSEIERADRTSGSGTERRTESRGR